MPNPRNYPDVMISAESGRKMHRGEKRYTVEVDGYRLTYRQPGWWCSLANDNDFEGQLMDEDNVIAEAARREAKALARNAALTPIQIKAIREKIGLSQKAASAAFGGGPKSFEKYESGEVSPSASIIKLLMLALEHPKFFKKKKGEVPLVSEHDAQLVRKAIRESRLERIYERVRDSKVSESRSR
jgi:HTH-type transcriptional regulator / antitoxin MqsA